METSNAKKAIKFARHAARCASSAAEMLARLQEAMDSCSFSWLLSHFLQILFLSDHDNRLEQNDA